MRAIILGLFLALTGCEGVTYRPISNGCLEIWTEIPLNQNKVDAATLDAMTILESRLGVDSCSWLRGQVVVVRADWEWDSWCQKVNGNYNAVEGVVYVNRPGTSLVHELYHLWQFRHGDILTGLHGEWDMNGYDADDRLYRQRLDFWDR